MRTLRAYERTRLKGKTSVGVAVFAKTIGLTSVKTRLAKAIGKDQAEHIYRLSIRCVQDVIREFAAKSNIDHNALPKYDVTAYWALAETQAQLVDSVHGLLSSEENGETQPSYADAAFWFKRQDDFQVLYQGDGDLGKRLRNVYTQLAAQHDVVLILGSDTPHLCPDILDTAVRTVTTASKAPENATAVVLGLARDGGFYLFCSSQELNDDFWQKVTYSQPDTCQALQHALRESHKGTPLSIFIDKLPMLSDIDEYSDLSQVVREMQAYPTTIHVKSDCHKFIENSAICQKLQHFLLSRNAKNMA